MVKTQKWYYPHNTRSAYFPINRRLYRERAWEREQERAWETKAMSICEMVKTQKWYYLCNTRSAYFPTDRRLHREGGEREWADSLSGHFIWNMNSYLMSVCTSSWSLHLTTMGGVYLTAYLGTSSENLDSYLILVTSSDNCWGVYLTAYLGTSSYKLT